jgi:hypothetical protein
VLTEETESEVLELQGGRRDFQIYAKANLPRKIQALLDHKDFEPKLAWIAKTLGASLVETQQALELLESLGIIGWEKGLIVKRTDYTSFTNYWNAQTKATLVADHRIISHQLLNDVDPDNRFFVQNGFITSDEETLKAYYERLLEVEKWFKQACEKSRNSLVVGYSTTIANIIKNSDGEIL